MALVGNISGSGGVSSTIGVTGSVIVANQPGGSFPTLPGSDVAFFVSGNIAARSPGSPATSPDYTVRGTTVFGGDVVVSGTLFGGSPLYIGDQVIARNGLIVTGAVNFVEGLSGSLTKLNDGTSYLIAGNNVTITTGSNGAVTIASTGGGGSGTNFFTETAAGVIYNSGTVAFTGARTGETITAASDKGADVVFYFSGSNAAVGAAGSNTALFGGNVISSGSFTVKTSSGGVVASISNGGVISGSSDLQAGGNLTIAGDAAIGGGDITTTATTFNLINTTATTVNFAGDATTLEIGSSTGTTDINNVLKVSGNQISGSAGGNITLQSSGDVEILGDLKVAGNEIKSSTGVTSLTFTGADVAIAGDLTVTGNDIKSSTATALTLAGANVTTAGSLTVTGDLTVNGTTITADVTTVSIEDPVIGLGFTSGSVTRGTPGDRGFIGGLDGENNIAFIWDESADGFAVIRTPNSTTSSLPVEVSDYQTLRAGKFELGGGTSVYVTSSAGTNLLAFSQGDATVQSSTGKVNLTVGTGQKHEFTFGSTLLAEMTSGGPSTSAVFGAPSGKALTLSGSTVRFNAGAGNGFSFRIDDSPYAQFVNSVSDAKFGATNNKKLIVSGAIVEINAGTAGVLFSKDLDTNPFLSFTQQSSTEASVGAGPTVTTLNLGVGATTTKVGKASTTLLDMGSTAGQTWISGSVTIPGTLSVEGAVTLGNATGDNITFTGRAASNLIPNANNQFDLGTPDLRWRNMYTGDLHLRNERGNWTIIEEEEYLSITNNLSGKRYKFVLEEL